MDAHQIAQKLAKRWAKDRFATTHYNGGELLRKDWLDQARVALAGPGNQPLFSGSFWGSKHPYDPSYGDVPQDLAPQVARAGGRGLEMPDQIQSELNTTTEKVPGTTTVAPSAAADPAAEPVGFGGSGNTGIKSRELGHASTAGETTLAAPVAAPPLPSTTTPGVNVAGNIAPVTPPPAVAPALSAGPSAIAPALLARPAPVAGNQAVAPTVTPKPPILA